MMSKGLTDRKSTRLNSSHTINSYAVFCLKKKKKGGALISTAPGGNSTAAGATHPRGTSTSAGVLHRIGSGHDESVLHTFCDFFYCTGGPPAFAVFAHRAGHLF